MDENEFDIYDDLDVFDRNDKQQEQCTSCLELREKLDALEEELNQLKNELHKTRKSNEILDRNNCSLLTTARAEVQRKDDQIQDLRKEKDNICFRRTGRPQRKMQTYEMGTQSSITCKPFITYELKKIDDQLDKLTDRNHRRDENHANNPFSLKAKEHSEIRVNQRNAEKDGNHRHQSRHQDDYNSSRAKHANQRNKEDERREQTNIERSKRKRSRSQSKDRKRSRRSRSRSRSPNRSHRRDRNAPDQSSPDKATRNQRSREKSTSKEQTRRQSPKRSSHKDDLRERLRSKRKSSENAPQRHSSKKKDAPPEQPDEQPMEIQVPNEEISVEGDSKDAELKIKLENVSLEHPVHIDLLSGNGYGDLEEGEIDENDKQIEPKYDPVDMKLHESSVTALKEYQSNLEVKSDVCADQKNESVQLQAAAECKASTDHKVSDKFGAPAVQPDDPHVYMASVKKEANGHLPLSSNGFDHQVKSIKGDGNTCKTEEVNNKNEGANLHEATIESHASLIKGDATVDQLKPKNDLTEGVNPSPQNIVASESPFESIEKTTQNTENIEKTAKLEKSAIVNQSASVNEHDGSKQSANSIEHKSPRELAIVNESKEIEKNADESTHSLNDVLNTSGNKVKNISTSTTNYLIVEDENNETTIYITRKSKKKRKGPKKTE